MGGSLVIMDDAMEELVNNQKIMLEHLTSTELMMKFGTVWNYLVRVVIFCIIVLCEYY